MLTLVALVLGGVALAYVPSRDVHDGILTTLRMIDLQHASLQRDVLQARAGLLRNYDPLVRAIAGLQASTDSLRRLLGASRRDGLSGFDDELSAISSSIASDERLVDQFKTSNSLLQNSLEIFNQLLGQRYQDPYFEGQPPSRRSGQLGNLMMRFAANPSLDLELQITAELDGLRNQAGSGRDHVRGLAAHAAMILKTMPSVDQTTLAIQGSGTLNTADALRRHYLDAYEAAALQLTRHRVVLGSVSLALFGFVATLVHRRREDDRKLTLQSRFDGMLDDIRRRFADNATAIDTAVDEALDLLAGFFEGPKGRFTMFNVETGAVAHAFGAARHGTAEAAVADAVARMANAPGAACEPSSKRCDVRIVPRGDAVDAALTVRLDAQCAALLEVTVDGGLRERGAELRILLEQAAECLVGCIRLVQDREERDALHARLEHSQRLEAVGTLAGGIAHEFNNILLAMMGYSEMALDASPGDSAAARYIQETIHSGQRAKLVIDQILAFSRKGGRSSKPFDIGEAVNDVLPLLTVSLPDHVALEVDLPSRQLTVTGNPIEVQQIIMNVCRNAAQACREAGWITITLSAVELRSATRLSHGNAPPGNYAVLRVADTGDGIEPGALPHIFEPFFTTRSEGGGTGLGLAAVHGAIVAMAGHVDVHSRVGNGTRFDLYFPVTHRPSVSIRDFTVDKSVPMGAGQTVVIAEGDEAARMMYEEKTAALGYEPIGFSSLTDVESWIAKRGRAADLVILDTGLWPGHPDPSGIKRHFDPVPILLIGEPPPSSIAGKGLVSQVQFLREPVTTTRLAWAISTALTEAETIGPTRPL
ncbi:MAG: two-component system VirA-like sensor kinase [Rhodopseudomonas palustris]|uniref:histidine kinase n=1 Tax=Rhodopseudomonas palustris TaxID=1076 RepID=A0A933W469_RHOPL|nr:two-component system VirA-like sensor kinase [Rhodopseudomonas palustris]